MAKYPQVQKKAQAQLDDFIGNTRLPELKDLESLPYVRAIVLETLRWMPSFPIGVPHTALTDDVYEGFYIPKGTVVIAVSLSLPSG